MSPMWMPAELCPQMAGLGMVVVMDPLYISMAGRDATNLYVLVMLKNHG